MEINRHIKIFVTLVTLFFAVLSCTSRKSEIDRSDIISPDKLTDIITDLYLTDGLMTLPIVHHMYKAPDSIAAYSDVIESHGYTKDVFDKTMRLYFIKKPKQLVRIYDLVLARLSEMESIYEQESVKFQSRMSNLWPEKEYYSFPDPEGFDSTGFDIRLPYPNTYVIHFTLTLFPDDQSVNPRMTAYICHPDSIETGTRKYVKTLNYIKDGQPRKYMYQVSSHSDRSRMHLRGRLFDFDNNPDFSENHLIVEKISITTSPEVE